MVVATGNGRLPVIFIYFSLSVVFLGNLSPTLSLRRGLPPSVGPKKKKHKTRNTHAESRRKKNGKPKKKFGSFCSCCCCCCCCWSAHARGKVVDFSVSVFFIYFFVAPERKPGGGFRGLVLFFLFYFPIFFLLREFLRLLYFIPPPPPPTHTPPPGLVVFFLSSVEKTARLAEAPEKVCRTHKISSSRLLPGFLFAFFVFALPGFDRLALVLIGFDWA